VPDPTTDRLAATLSPLSSLLPLLPAAVRSTWALAPIPVNGVLSAPEWAGAGVLAIPRGRLLVKNDATFLWCTPPRSRAP
jgi:hypothetical protein